MTVSKAQVVLPFPVQKVWDTVTSLEDYAWRSDLSRVEVVPPARFIEYTKEGFPTTFTVTATVPAQRWEFDMENANITGHWVGVFTAEAGGTKLELTEEITPRKKMPGFLMKLYLKQQQKTYIRNLERALQG